MNLLRPMRRWIARSPLEMASWLDDLDLTLDGLELTQEDIDRELLNREVSHAAFEAADDAPRIASVTFLPEGLGA